MAEMVGASLAGLTVSRKLVLMAPKLVSMTEIVIVEVPNWFRAGLIVTVRLLALPPKTMFDIGARFVLDDCAASVSSAAGVAESPIVNGTAAVGVSSAVTTLAMLEMVGAALPDTVERKTKLRLKVLFAAWPSLTVTVTIAEPATPLTCR